MGAPTSPQEATEAVEVAPTTPMPAQEVREARNQGSTPGTLDYVGPEPPDPQIRLPSAAVKNTGFSGKMLTIVRSQHTVLGRIISHQDLNEGQASLKLKTHLLTS